MSRRRKPKRDRATAAGSETSLVAGARRLLEHRLPDAVPEVVPSPDGVKMSDVLERFVEPYRSDDETIEDFRGLLGVAVIAWNIALLPWSKHAEAIEKVAGGLPPELRADMKRSIRGMILRKRREFGDCKRLFFNFDLQERGDEYYVSVVTSPGEAVATEGAATDDQPGQGPAPSSGVSNSE